MVVKVKTIKEFIYHELDEIEDGREETAKEVLEKLLLMIKHGS